MIEVRTTVPALQPIAVTASSAGSTDVQRSSGNRLPDGVSHVAANEAPQKPEKAEGGLKDAVASISEYVQSVQRNLQFSVDEELNQTVVKVVDGGSGELIRQIPEEAFLELARKLNEGGELRLVNALG